VRGEGSFHLMERLGRNFACTSAAMGRTESEEGEWMERDPRRLCSVL
jgi:hypothetical protein